MKENKKSANNKKNVVERSDNSLEEEEEDANKVSETLKINNVVIHPQTRKIITDPSDPNP